MARFKRKMIGEANSFLHGGLGAANKSISKGFGQADRTLLGKRGRRVRCLSKARLNGNSFGQGIQT